MKLSRRITSLALCLALLLAAATCALGEGEAVEAHARRLRLGSSYYTLEIDDSYVYGEVSEEDRADDMVSCLYSEQSHVDFDVYQFSKAGLSDSLEDYVVEESEDYDAVTEIEPEGVVNDIPAAWYRTTEEKDGEPCETITYILDNDDQYVEIVFWLDSAEAEDEARAIIRTLSYVDVQLIRLGTSPFIVIAMSDFVENPVSEAERAEGMVACWKSGQTLLDFDVYQLDKADLPHNLADFAAADAANYADVTDLVTDSEVNGIPLASFRATKAYDGAVYPILVCVLDDGEAFVKTVFRLDGLTAGSEADAMLLSLWNEEALEAALAAPAEADAGDEAPAAATRTRTLRTRTRTLRTRTRTLRKRTRTLRTRTWTLRKRKRLLRRRTGTRMRLRTRRSPRATPPTPRPIP